VIQRMKAMAFLGNHFFDPLVDAQRRLGELQEIETSLSKRLVRRDIKEDDYNIAMREINRARSIISEQVKIREQKQELEKARILYKVRSDPQTLKPELIDSVIWVEGEGYRLTCNCGANMISYWNNHVYRAHLDAALQNKQRQSLHLAQQKEAERSSHLKELSRQVENQRLSHLEQKEKLGYTPPVEKPRGLFVEIRESLQRLGVDVQESFQWAQRFQPILDMGEYAGRRFYRVIAARADVKNANGRVYTNEELSRAGSSLSERPIDLNHDANQILPFNVDEHGLPENGVVVSRYDAVDKVLEAIVAIKDARIVKMIESGEIHGVSVDGRYLDQSRNTSETEYPTSLHFRRLALLTSAVPPSDPGAGIVA
jgi:hypothetical protein